MERAFIDIGYTWVDESPLSIRTLDEFVFDPTTVISMANSNDDKTDDDVGSLINESQRLTSSINKNMMKQLRIDQFIGKN